MWENFVEYMKEVFFALLSPVWDFIKWCIAEIFDIFCTLIEMIVGAISLPAELTTSAFNWAGLPPQVLYVLDQLGISVCISILMAALTVRLTLNLIPGAFTRV